MICSQETYWGNEMGTAFGKVWGVTSAICSASRMHSVPLILVIARDANDRTIERRYPIAKNCVIHVRKAQSLLVHIVYEGLGDQGDSSLHCSKVFCREYLRWI